MLDLIYQDCFDSLQTEDRNLRSLSASIIEDCLRRIKDMLDAKSEALQQFLYHFFEELFEFIWSNIEERLDILADKVKKKNEINCFIPIC